MKAMKYAADFLTASRLLIALCLGWLGWSRGIEGLQPATLLMISSWVSDVLDGSLARRSKASNSWIGNHDLYFDMAAAIGLLIFMTAAGCINVTISILYSLIWILLFSRFGVVSALGKLFQAPIYAWFILISFQFEPLLGGLMVIFLFLVVAFTWPRFPNDTVPGFISGFNKE